MKYDVTVRYQTQSSGGSKCFRGLDADSEDAAIDVAHARLKKNKAVLKINGGDVVESSGQEDSSRPRRRM